MLQYYNRFITALAHVFNSGRIKLSQVLLSLLVIEPKYSYIQGMDSLAAVCLKLFYSSPPRALLLLRSLHPLPTHAHGAFSRIKSVLNIFRAIIDRFLGKVVYKQQYSDGTDWLLLRLRR